MRMILNLENIEGNAEKFVSATLATVLKELKKYPNHEPYDKDCLRNYVEFYYIDMRNSLDYSKEKLIVNTERIGENLAEYYIECLENPPKEETGEKEEDFSLINAGPENCLFTEDELSEKPFD